MRKGLTDGMCESALKRLSCEKDLAVEMMCVRESCEKGSCSGNVGVCF